MMKKTIISIAAAVAMTSQLSAGLLSENGDVVFGGEVFTLSHNVIYLDGSLTDAQAAASPYIYNNVNEALKSLDAVSATLLVEPSVYWLDNPDDDGVRTALDDGIPYAVTVSTDTLRIIGLSHSPADVVWAVNRGQTQGAVGNYTMVHFTGHSLNLANMTFGNYCNVDLNYVRDPKQNREKRRDAIVQAQIGICSGTDRLFADNCEFISRLNMCPFVGATRSLFRNCYFECTDDAMAGSAVYLDCRFTWFSSKPFYSTASTGAVFLNCDIELRNRSTQYITKVPGMVTLIDTRFHHPDGVTPETFSLKWTRDMSPVICYQSNVTVNGQEVTVDASRPMMTVDISDRGLLDAYKISADDHTLYNTPNLLGGLDGWDPLGVRPEVEAIGEELGVNLLGIPVKMASVPDHVHLKYSGDSVNVAQTYWLWGGSEVDRSSMAGRFPLSVQWKFPDYLKVIPSGEDNRADLTGDNVLPETLTGIVTASNSFGWRSGVEATVGPCLKDAPTLLSRPKVTLDAKNHALKLNYEISPVDVDNSLVAWYRYNNTDLSDTIRVYQGRGKKAALYPLSIADAGYRIIAMITPKGDDTKPGRRVMANFPTSFDKRIIERVAAKQGAVSTDFSEIPVGYQPKIGPGWWTFDAYKPADTARYPWTADPRKGWYYGKSTDGATGVGLVQRTRGARMFYTPALAESGDMVATLVVEPAKSAGQGFGSATGQYMDIYIKFDPVTLTGYGLRIERTPDYDKAVVFTLMRYDNGVATPVSKPQASSCYRTPCTIEVAYRKGHLTAKASTEADLSGEPRRKDISRDVALITPLPDNKQSAFGIQHTGTTGASATLIRHLDLNWK